MGGVQRIRLSYGPRRQFQAFHDRAQRWGILVAHRRAGKTVACINDLIRRAVQISRPHGRYAYVAPFLAQGKEVAWEYLKRFSLPICADKNEGELWVELINGARIRIHGADNPDRLRGAYLDGIVLDEYADMRPTVWGEIIRPMLADRQGWAVFIGTPKGRNEFFDKWDKAEGDPDWFRLMLKASETGILPPDELADAAKDMTPEQYAQEFECSFDAAIMGSYYGSAIADAERHGRITEVPYDPALPVQTAWDLGIGDSTAIWLFQVCDNQLRVIDFIESHGKALPYYVGELRARHESYGTDWVPHDAKVRSLETGRTRIETLQGLGRKPRLVPDHKVLDGINAARVSFPRVWIDKDKCKFGIEALRQYRAAYDEKLKVFKNDPLHDWTSHAADAFRYMAMAWKGEMVGPHRPQQRKDLLIFEADETGKVHANMSVREIIDMKRRKRMANA